MHNECFSQDRLNAELKNEELGATEMNVHYCEPEQGSILGEDEDEGIDEIKNYHVFETKKMFVNAGYVGIDDGEWHIEGIDKRLMYKNQSIQGLILN